MNSIVRNDNRFSRDIGLDALKVIATFAVIKLHCGYKGYASEIIHYLCGFAVPIFFMVSGALTLNRRDGVSWKYILHRVSRILLLMIIWNIPFIVIECLKNRKLINPIKYVIEAFFQQGFLWHFWYLWALLILCLISPLLYPLLHNEKKKEFTTLFLLSSCFILSMCTIFLSVNGYKTIEQVIPQTLRLWSHVLYYWLGGVIYKKIKIDAEHFTLSYYKWYYLIIFSISIAVFQLMFCTQILKLHSPENLFTNLIITLWIGTVFVFGCSLELKNENPLYYYIEHLIKLSLGMYILHPFIILTLQTLNIWKEEQWLINYVMISIGTFLMAEIISRIPLINKIIKM